MIEPVTLTPSTQFGFAPPAAPLHRRVAGIREDLAPLIGQYPFVIGAYVYGSYLRSDFQHSISDIDILIVADDRVAFRSLEAIASSIQAAVHRAEVTILSQSEVRTATHPGWSRHYFVNVARSGVLVFGDDCLGPALEHGTTLQDAHRRIVQLCQRSRLVLCNRGKEGERQFWLEKYQHWIPLCLMELLDLHGVYEPSLQRAQATFAATFPQVRASIEYPYADLRELQLFLEEIAIWVPDHANLFTDRVAI